MSLLSRLAVQAARAYGILSARSTNVSADYLVVAGGAGGGRDIGGGGGAGGLLASTATLSTLNTYSITVGGGGAGSTVVTSKGVNGSNSVISGTGLTTITSIGGGGGGSNDPTTYTGNTGGSGGGSSALSTTSPSGTAGQGNSGGAGNNNLASGGGGGAGAAGTAGSGTSTSGNGGNGSASSISGSSVTYAGGGGGGGYSLSASVGTGGTGGGGDGVKTGTAVSGTVNLGGGGGGGGTAGGAGGSGIVIISYTSATPKFVGGTITTSGGKQIHTFTSSGTLSPITPITASYLVVAGGGGGKSGGGGAGGLLTGSTTIYSGATYVVTVGAGGAGQVSNGSSGAGNQGSSSILSGTGLSTITSTGGGGGGNSVDVTPNGGNGGSGGGGGGTGYSPVTTAGGTGISGQGNNGGTNSTINVAPYPAGGGGGAGAVGGNASSGTGGSGGNGTASSISGSSVTYAGGGGGGTATSGTGGSGGSGGGGAGSGSGNGTSGTTNLGGGGGGAINASTGGSGGSGIVIISYAGSQVFNGGLVTTSGGNTIHTFTSSGALTPLTNNLNNSLRFRSSASANLSRTPTLATNRTTWTWSSWVKRGTLSTEQVIFGSGTSANDVVIVEFSTADKIDIVGNIGGVTTLRKTTTQVFRDPSAWYHIVLAVDTTQATAGNRVKLYVNGNQVTDFSASTDPSLNQTYQVNNNVIHTVSRYSVSASLYFDGYMTDINFIDGQALEPYYFGNNDANGVWKPILYKGTYGTNGFYLTFGNTTSTTTLGYDSSPNGNNWTTNNISLTAGTTYDAMTDVPTNTSATVANYAVLNPLNKGSSLTVSDGNLYADATTTTVATTYSTLRIDTATYWENYISATDAAGYPLIGAGTGTSTGGVTGAGSWNVGSDGYTYLNGTSANAGYTFTSTDIIQCAYDPVTGKFWLGKNNTWFGSGNPATGANPVATIATSNQIYALVSHYGNSNSSANFGQRPFSYTPPTGYVALNTYNLPTPTILQGNKYMDATAYVATGTAPQTVVNAGQFKPDLVWTKNRTSAGNHYLNDSVRGAANALNSNTTSAEASLTNYITSFNSNGYGIGSDNFTSGQNVIGWQWQAGQGTTSSNTSGSITSTVSVNTTAGFSVVTFSNPTTGSTIGHGLGVAPKMMIVKDKGSVSNWQVYHASLGNNANLRLNLTDGQNTPSNLWNTTTPTSTVFTFGSGFAGSYSYVVYCFAEIAGFSAFGSYTGNSSTDGPFIYTGFRPKFVLFKISSGSTGNWFILDTSRSTYNEAVNLLNPDTSDAAADVSPFIDILSNGIKIRRNSVGLNNSGYTYIYATFAENPTKISNAR